MRISDRLIPAAIFTVGLGLVSAFGFEGTNGQRDGTAPGIAPAAAVDTLPRAAMPGPVPPMPVPNVAPGRPSGTNAAMTPAKPATRSLTPHQQTPGEAFLSGTHALEVGDAKTAIQALEYAAENGHALAEWKLGRMYADGDLVGRDDLRAFDYFQDIVENHSDDTVGTPQQRFVSNAYVALGGYFLSGIPNSPVKADPRRARDLYAYAASYFGDAEAQYRLGRMLLDGQGGPRDAWQAVRWLKLSADKGHLQSQVLLGVTLFRGDGIPRQAPRGLMYLTLASAAAPKDQAIAQLLAAATAQATPDERAIAYSFLEARIRGEWGTRRGD
jgi:TPR repeat protein